MIDTDKPYGDEIQLTPGVSVIPTFYGNIVRLAAPDAPRPKAEASIYVPPDESRVLSLIAAGRQIPEIADMLGWSPGFVRWRIRRAVHYLKALLL